MCAIEILGAYFKNVFKQQQALQLNWLVGENQNEPVSLGTQLFRSSKTAVESRVKAATFCHIQESEMQNKLL